jgi:CYTH domain-containing protein
MGVKTNLSDGKHFEIEHKYLCVKPAREILEGKASEVVKIEQTYLKSPEGEERRVRKITRYGKVSYVLTKKWKLSGLKRIEKEVDISKTEYERYLKDAEPGLHTIKKTRYKVFHLTHVFEIDVYDFDNVYCIMEVEVHREDDKIVPPDFICIDREVTDDERFKNRSLAATLTFFE